MEPVVSAHTVDNRYPDTCGYLTEVEAHKRPRSILKCKTTTEVDVVVLNLLKPNDIYICRTAAPTSRRYILNVYSTNIRTEYFKHAA